MYIDINDENISSNARRLINEFAFYIAGNEGDIRILDEKINSVNSRLDDMEVNNVRQREADR